MVFIFSMLSYAKSLLAVALYLADRHVNLIFVHTSPGDDWSCSEDGILRCCWWGILFVSPAPSPTNLPTTSSDLSPQKAQSQTSLITLTPTGISMMQSSARHSLVTQCKNTVDIF